MREISFGKDSSGTISYQYKCSQPPQSRCAREVNQTLNLNLGLDVNPMNPRLRRFLRTLSDFFQLFEEYVFDLWEFIPLRWRQKITFLGWSIFFPLHRRCFGNRTGIHRDASLEYHALTTLLYWGRLFPVTIRRMRFSLSQLSVWHPPSRFPISKPLKRVDSKNSSFSSATETSATNPCCECCRSNLCHIDGISANVFHVHHDMKDVQLKLSDPIHSKQGATSEDNFVTGFYLQHGDNPSDIVIFWLYGGAFLSGDSKGNLNIGMFFIVIIFPMQYLT